MLDKKYDFKNVEKDKYNTWKNKGYFNSGDLTKEPYCIVIPPPNVTGKLHLGHAWDTAIQDIIVRLGKRCGIKITPKSFRKTTSTVYYEKYGAGVAARQLGHTTTRMVETVYSDMDTIYRNTFPRMGRDSRNSAIIS